MRSQVRFLVAPLHHRYWKLRCRFGFLFLSVTRLVAMFSRMPTSAPPVRPEDEYASGPSKSSSHATVALVVGIVSIFIFGIVLGAIAIFMGLRARKEIDDSNGSLTGRGQATAAIFLGAAAVVVWSVVLIVSISSS